jgi:hypothetical protein
MLPNFTSGYPIAETQRPSQIIRGAERLRLRQAKVASAGPTHSDAQLFDAKTCSCLRREGIIIMILRPFPLGKSSNKRAPPTPSPLIFNLLPVKPITPFAGHGDLCPSYVPPTTFLPLALVQYTKSQSTDRPVRYTR